MRKSRALYVDLNDERTLRRLRMQLGLARRSSHEDDAADGNPLDEGSALAFGDVLGGNVDATPAIQHAVNQAENGIVSIPAGTYRLDGAVTISRPIAIHGAGDGRTILQTSSDSLPIFSVQADDVLIQDMTFTTSVTRTTGGHVEYFSNMKRNRIERCTFIDFYYGVVIGGTSSESAVISRCHFHHGGSASSSKYGVWIDGGKGHVVELGHIHSTTSAKAFIGVYISGSTESCLIAGCSMETVDTGVKVVKTADTGDVTIERCRVKDAIYGYHLEPSSGNDVRRVRLVKCEARSCTTHGVYLKTSTTNDEISDITLTDVTASGSTTDGIHIEKVNGAIKNVQIGGADCKGNGGDGIEISGVEEWALVKSTCASNTGYGLRIGSGCAGYTVDSSNFKSNTAGAVTDSSLSADRYIRNNTPKSVNYQIVCRVARTTNESVNDATDETLLWTSEIDDPESWHDLVSNTDRITVNRDGMFMVGRSLQWEGNSGGNSRRAWFYLNATDKFGHTRLPANVSASVHDHTVVKRKLTAGDYVVVVVRHDAGTAISIEAVTGSGEGQSPQFWVAEVDD